MKDAKEIKIGAYYDAALSIPPQSNDPVYQSAYQECKGYFDASVGLTQKSDHPSYQQGYSSAG